MKALFENIKWGWHKDAVPIFVLLVLSGIFFQDTLFGGKIFVHRDISRFFYPLREFSVNQFHVGKIPLWNPYIHCGSPHLAELQTCVFYPLSAIYLLFPFPQAFNYFIILHIFLAGLFTYILMREWGYSNYASFMSGVVYMFGGYIVSVINLLASLASVVWVPLVVLFYERALKKDWVKNSIYIGIFMAFMLLGGEPAILLGTVFILILISLTCRGGLSLPCMQGVYMQGVKSLLIALMVVAGLTLFQILPFLEFLKHTSRSVMDFNEASMWSLPPYALMDLFVPYLSESDYLYKDYWTRQSWLLVYYMGLFTLICSLISLKFDTSKKRRLIFYILASGLLLSFGRYTPLYYFLYKFLPGFSLSRYPIKFFFMVAFSLSILAGMGLDYYRQNVLIDSNLQRFLKRFLVIAFLASIFYLIINLYFNDVYTFFYNRLSNLIEKKNELSQLLYAGIYNLKRAFGILMALAIFMFLPAKKKLKSGIAVPILILISVTDIFTANRNVYQNMDINEYLQPGPTIEFLKKDDSLYRIFNSPATLRQNTFVPEGDYFEGFRALKERLVSNSGVSFGIYDGFGYGSLYRKRHEELIGEIIKLDLPDETNLLNLLNVKYVISPKDFKAEGFGLVKKGEKANIYENENVLPRAFLADRALVIKDEKKILDRLKSKNFNPAEEVILEEHFSFANHPSASLGTGEPRTTNNERVAIFKYSPNEVIIEARVSTSKFLILSDSYYPGWKAYVDGKEAKIYRADYIFRGVLLSPGEHIVRFTYELFSFKIGVVVTLATILLIVICGVKLCVSAGLV